MKTFVKILEVLAIIISAALLIGVTTYFHACGLHDDTYPSCHWAQVMVQGLSILLIVQSILALIIPAGQVKGGISIAMIPTAFLIAAVPGILIPLCLSRSMACWTRLRPFSLAGSLVMAGLVLIHTLFAILSARNSPKKNNGEDLRMSSRGRTAQPAVPDRPEEENPDFIDPEGID